MKNKALHSVFLAVVLVLITVCTCVGAEATEVNGNEVQVGEVVTYEIHASGCTQVIQAVDIGITYDPDALEYVSDSLELPNLSGTLINDTEKGILRFNALDLQGFSFYEDKIVATMQFKVISDYAPYQYISSEVRNFIDADMTEHTDEFVYYLTLTDSEIQQIADGSPSRNEIASQQTALDTDINSDEEKTSESQSEITDRTVSAAAAQQSDTSISDVSADTHTSDTVETADTLGETVKPTVSKPVNYSVIFFAAAGMMVVIAVIAVLFLIKMKHSDTNDTQ